MTPAIFHVAAQGQTACGKQATVNSLVMPHANSQNRFGKGELQHQFVFGVSGLSSIIPDQNWDETIQIFV